VGDRRQPLAAPGTADLVDRGVTRREAEVLEALRDRLTNAEVAARLYVSERTVESHVSSLPRKLDAQGRRDPGRVARNAGGHVATGGAGLAAGSGAGRRIRTARRASVGARPASPTLSPREQGRTLAALGTGEAGIGKSRLVADLSSVEGSARDRGPG
jgi:DNA-binding CsgD family transcriptional regulator